MTAGALLGYFLGNTIPGIDRHIDIVIVVVVALSLLPVAIHALKERAQARGESLGEKA